jgi:protein SCO1
MSSFERRIKKFAAFLIIAVAFLAASSSAGDRYSATGLVLQVDRTKQIVVVSCESIPNVMDAMVMSFPVRDVKSLEGLKPGMKIDFTIATAKEFSYAEGIHIRAFQSLENDPSEANRLSILENMLSDTGRTKDALTVGQAVPDFKLVDQDQQQVALSDFAGKVVAVTFVYVRCPLPNYCFRLSSNFAQLQKRFKNQIGRNLVLLTIIIDPVHDQPQSVKEYARIWNADPKAWHFLTGSPAAIQQICARFDMKYYPDEALLVHSFHTVVIDRHARLASNIEGNDFTARQLGDLVETVMADSPYGLPPP